MPTIIIKNGDRKLKLTKRERDTLDNADAILSDVAANFLGDDEEELGNEIGSAREAMRMVVSLASDSNKPAGANGERVS